MEGDINKDQNQGKEIKPFNKKLWITVGIIAALAIIGIIIWKMIAHPD